jgi:hypothetical protein
MVPGKPWKEMCLQVRLKHPYLLLPQCNNPLSYSSKCKVRNVVGHPTKLSACPLYHKEVPHHSIRATPTAMPIAAMAHEISLSHVWEKKRNKNKIKQNKQPAFIRLMYACMHVWMYVCLDVMTYLQIKPDKNAPGWDLASKPQSTCPGHG